MAAEGFEGEVKVAVSVELLQKTSRVKAFSALPATLVTLQVYRPASEACACVIFR